MKQILNFAIVTLLAGGFASCSSEGDAPEVPGGKTDGAVAIRLGSKVKTNLNVITRADGVSNEGPIDNTTGSITFGIAGWEKRQTADVYAAGLTDTDKETFAKGALWATTAQCVVSNNENKSVTWTKQMYYNADEFIKTSMKAWYPAGSIDESNQTVTFENQSGEIDALLADVICSDKWDDNVNNHNLNFKHKTAQIKFAVKAGDGLEAETKLKSITLNNVKVPVGFSLTANNDGANAVTYSSEKNLLMPGYTALSTEINQYTTTSALVGRPVMIQPMTGKTFNVTVETNKAKFENMQVTVNTDNIEAGIAYTIVLTFKQEEIVLTATTSPWQTNDGTGTVI